MSLGAYFLLHWGQNTIEGTFYIKKENTGNI